MLKLIFSAIAVILRAVARMLGRVAAAPFRMLNRLFGGSAGPIDMPEVAPPEPVEPTPTDNTQLYADIANAIMRWCADSVIADRPIDLPPRLPIAVREWLPGVTRDECWTIMNAEKTAVSAHIQRLFPIPGVRPVQRLTRLTKWPAEPVEPGPPGFAGTIAIGWPDPFGFGAAGRR
jgi:hypothetical protein